MKRIVYYVSDSTGITAATLGQALLSQFDGLDYEPLTIPFVDSEEKIQQLVQEINATGTCNATRPLVFCTFGNGRLRDQLRHANALVLDLMHDFIKQLEHELGLPSSHALGHFHAVLTDPKNYENRINAVDFTIAHDDGISPHHYADAELVLIGVSRTGKTPVSVYLAIQFGVKVANYPLTDSDLLSITLPQALADNRRKLFALTIDAQRLHEIRSARRPDSPYSSLPQCSREIHDAEALYRHTQIEYLNTSKLSIEEIASQVLTRIGYRRSERNRRATLQRFGSMPT